jgi:putative peptide zinc metalloprotease protein
MTGIAVEPRGQASEPEYLTTEGWRIDPFDTASLEPMYVLENADGKRWEVSAATARCLEGLAAREPLEVIAQRLAAEFNQALSVDALRKYVDRTIRPMGVLVGSYNAPDDERRRERRLRYLSVRHTILSAEAAAPVTRALARLFEPRHFWWYAALVAALSVEAMWFASHRGANPLAAFFTPATLALLLLSGFVHELGHGAACARLGAKHGALGAGLYLVFPVLYMELDDAWRLKRTERALIDAAGLYLQLLFGLVVFAISVLWEPLRPAAFAMITVLGLGALLNLNPIFRFDGYWLLSDLLGVPNLRGRSLRSVAAAWRTVRGVSASASEAPRETMPAWIAHALAGYGLICLAFFAYWTRGIAVYLARVPAELIAAVAAVAPRVREAIASGHLGETVRLVAPLLLPMLALLGAVLALAMLVESGRHALIRQWRGPSNLRIASAPAFAQPATPTASRPE